MNQSELFQSAEEFKQEQENIIQFLKDNDLYNNESYILNLHENLKPLYLKKESLEKVISAKALCFGKDYGSDFVSKYNIRNELVFSVRSAINIPNQRFLIALRSSDLIGTINL